MILAFGKAPDWRMVLGIAVLEVVSTLIFCSEDTECDAYGSSPDPHLCP